MKILFVVEHFYPYIGGAEELFLNLTVSLVEAGYDVEVVTTLHNKSLKKNDEHKGVKICRVRCYNRFLFTIFSLPRILSKAKGAICIHTTSYNSAIPASIAGLLLRKKVVITFHEVWGKLWFNLPFTPKWLLAFYYLYEWFILRIPFYKYVAVSRSTKNALISSGISERKIMQIYNGIDYSALGLYRHLPPDNFTFCFFGRLGISKGIDLLLEATRDFVSHHPEASLKLIIPTYPKKLARKVSYLINSYHLEKNIILLHNLSKDDLLKEVSSSSCVIIPSQSEGFCFVAVESAGMGVPVISSGKGSLPEVVSGQNIVLETLSASEILSSLEKAINNEWKFTPTVQFPLKDSINNYLSLYENLKNVPQLGE